jgi:hypothetical protein
MLSGSLEPPASILRRGEASPRPVWATQMRRPYRGLVVVLAETRAVGRSYGSRGALMLRERRPVRFNRPSRRCARNRRPRAQRCRARCRDWRWQCGRRRTSARRARRLSGGVALSRGLSLGLSWVFGSRTTWSSCLFGGGLGSPPVTLGLSFALVCPLSDAWAYPRTSAANRSAD